MWEGAGYPIGSRNSLIFSADTTPVLSVSGRRAAWSSVDVEEMRHSLDYPSALWLRHHRLLWKPDLENFPFECHFLGRQAFKQRREVKGSSGISP